MAKTVEIIGLKWHHGTYTEGVTEVNGNLVARIDTSALLSQKLIVLHDKEGYMLREIFLSEGFIASVTHC
ncbi:hypothetical protein [Bacillus cereus]|uniref:hypothetical protein n=1 Tax=Bacillus cereus TaxID=1396 RepID=UPI00397EC2E7